MLQNSSEHRLWGRFGYDERRRSLYCLVCKEEPRMLVGLIGASTVLNCRCDIENIGPEQVTLRRCFTEAKQDLTIGDWWERNWKVMLNLIVWWILGFVMFVGIISIEQVLFNQIKK